MRLLYTRQRIRLNRWIVVIAAIWLLAAGVYGCISTATAAHAVTHSRCGSAPYRASGKRSLMYVATHVAKSPVSQVLAATAFCTPRIGGLPRYYPSLAAYLNHGDLSARLPEGTRLWFSQL